MMNGRVSSWQRLTRGLACVGMVTMVLGFGACSSGSDQPGGDGAEEALDPETFTDPDPVGKEDNAGVAGPLYATNTSETQVWSAKNAWEDIDTDAAKKAGLAWGENSGLNWDQKYKAWIQSMEKTATEDGYAETFLLTTPYGRTLKTPKLECSEVAMFLRISFASWYQLPFYMTATDSAGTRVYFGHFGARTINARYKNTPKYAVQYKDYSDMTAEQIAASWPKDAGLRTKGLGGGGDDMDYIAPGAKAGAYFDEVFLNKRVGHFMWMMLDYFGSMNLANSRNTYNLKPQAVNAGDVLVERWQRNGIGHTLVVKEVTPLDGGGLEAQLVSGSMPRRQPEWDNAVASKQYFTNEATGGVGTSYDGDEYVKLGGGLKRWRVTKNIRGAWTNTWMAADESSWINDTDYDNLKKRPQEFQSLLGEVPPEQMRDALVTMINDARDHLKKFPASCSARTNREAAFTKLYKLNLDSFGISKEDTDAQYRTTNDDYIFAELIYPKSKTCCWNSTTAAMYDIVVKYAEAKQQCAVFKAENGGYQKYADFAASLGRSAEWKSWTEDEPCAQRDVAADTETAHEWTSTCKFE